MRTAFDEPMQSNRLGARRLLLVVDDDARSAELLGRLLRDDGWDVEVASDGGKALQRLEQKPLPDAIVTDLRMPDVDGLELARRARIENPGLPVFVVTCYPELVDLGQLDPRPQVFTKPVVYDDLTAALRALPSP